MHHLGFQKLLERAIGLSSKQVIATTNVLFVDVDVGYCSLTRAFQQVSLDGTAICYTAELACVSH